MKKLFILLFLALLLFASSCGDDGCREPEITLAKDEGIVRVNYVWPSGYEGEFKREKVFPFPLCPRISRATYYEDADEAFYSLAGEKAKVARKVYFRQGDIYYIYKTFEEVKE